MPTISSLPYTINSSGLYKLSGTLTMASAGTAITINADNVDLDLNGCAILHRGIKSATGDYGIRGDGRSNIRIHNGSIDGAFYGIYMLSPESGYTSTSQPLPNGNITIENMNISNSAFRGVRIEGNNCIVRNSDIVKTGGGTAYNPSYGMGIESIGASHIIENNNILETRGTGSQDVAEGVGISFTRYSVGCVARGNTISNNAREIDSRFYGAWAGESRTSYGFWVGSGCDVSLYNNDINHYYFGLCYKRDAEGYADDNRMNGCMVNYYYPRNSGTKPEDHPAKFGNNNRSNSPDIYELDSNGDFAYKSGYDSSYTGHRHFEWYEDGYLIPR